MTMCPVREKLKEPLRFFICVAVAVLLSAISLALYACGDTPEKIKLAAPLLWNESRVA